MKNIKKVELHLHFDGSINKEHAEKLLNKNLDTELKAKDKCEDLKEYLEKFDLPISLLQTKENLENFSYLLTKDLEEDNVIYAEIRFCPLFHTKDRLTGEEVIESVLKGLSKNKNVKTNLILCMMRNFSKEENKQVIMLAEKFFNKGVVAVDLAGDEASYKNELFEDLFLLAKEKQIPYTIHSGEAGGYENVLSAIMYGAKRIGHGIKTINDNETLEKVINGRIILEVCPTSNVQTNATDKYSNHPIKDLYEKGVLVTISTDNRTVSNITLQEEYEKLQSAFGFSEEDFMTMNKNAIYGAFLSDSEKENLIEELTKY